MTHVRVATSDDLRSIHSHDVEKRLPRRLTGYVLEHLDPDGTHLLVLRGSSTGAGILRCEAILALTGEDLPSTAYLDVTAEDWRALRQLEEVYDVMVRQNREGDAT